MKRKRQSLFAAGLVLSALSMGVCAERTAKRLEDVSADAWYSDCVECVCQAGIMEGTAENVFSPDSTLTVAEGVTIAARIASLVSDTEIPEADGEWYQKYVDYAEEKGLMAGDRFADYSAQLKRHEMASLLAPLCADYPVINEVERVVDVNATAPYEKDVLTLYRAGILTGNDEYGNFSPESSLTRAEAAAVVSRVAYSERRVSKEFEVLDVRSYSDGYALIVNTSGTGRTNNSIANGWDYDNRFELSNTSGWPKKYVTDTNDTAFTALIRNFGEERDGVLTLEMMVELWSQDGGLYISFEDEAGNRSAGLGERNGKWVLFGAEETMTETEAPSSLTLVSFLITLDLDKGYMNASIDNRFVGSVALSENTTASRLVLGTNEHGSGSVNISHVKLYKNYAVFDRFAAVERVVGETPLGYTTKGDFSIQKMDVGEELDMYSVRGSVKGGESAFAVRTFDPICGNVDVKTHVLLPTGDDGASFSLMTAGSEVLTLRTENGYFYIGSKKLKSFSKNIWQDLRIEANTATGKAIVRINSQQVAEVDFNAAYIDGVKYAFAPSEDAVMWFDDLEIQCRVEHEDYVPEPVVAESDYKLGMYSCYLWRDAVSGEGWDSVSSFPEFEPVLGYYDEGLRETADWEIKQMVEHGIDFVEMCWYSPKDNLDNPIKRTRVSHEAIHDGFLTAKYSDLMEYCILWETSYKGASSFEQFKEYIWNYWKDYYFSDDRYLTIDNKIVIFTWASPSYFSSLLGEDSLKQAMEELETDVMDTLGYDGILWVSANLLTSDDSARSVVETGFAGAGGRWIGAASNNASEQIRYIDMNEQYATQYGTAYIPCISPGYNDVGRNNTRTGMIGAKEHLKVCEYVKQLLDARSDKNALGNMVIIDSWNEYSEGHSSAPTVENGYMYLDNIRTTFTDAPQEHSALDEGPTDEQKDRITHLYPDNHSPIRWFMYEGSDNGIRDSRDPNKTSGANAVAVVTWDMSRAEGTEAWDKGHGLTDYSESGGVISATASGDSSIVLKKLPDGLSLDEATILHMHIKSSVNDTAQVYFATETAPSLGESKKITFAVSNGEHDYYVDLSSNAEWKGALTSLRIDILNTAGRFEVSLIELMRSKYDSDNPAPRIYIDHVEHKLVFLPVETEDGDYEIAAEATIRGFFSSLRLYHEWDRFTDDGVLTVKTRDKKTYVFRVGSDTVTVDGEERELGYTFKLRDGLPVFHIKKLCDLLDYEYTEASDGINIHVATDEELALKTDAAHGNWDYTKLTEVGDWKPRQASVSVVNGFLNIIPTDTDSSISTTVNWKAEDYTHALIGIRYTEGAENWIVNLFFGTDTVGIGTKTCIVQKVETDGYEKGDIIELKLDMTANVNWTGTINALRFDPHWTMDPVYIQYIRFIKDEENASLAGSEKAEETGADEFPSLPDVVLDLKESDTVHPKYGLLLAETDFSNDGKVSYINEDYIDSFGVGVVGVKSTAYTDGKAVGKKAGDTVLDIVPSGTAAHRLSYSFGDLKLQKGKYTLTTSVYVPQSNSDVTIFRMDVLEEGKNIASSVNPGKGKWKTMEWSFEVLSVNGDKVLFSYGDTTAAKASADMKAANLWIVKTSTLATEHFYYDDVRLYYDPGTLGTDPEYSEPQDESAVIVYDEECTLYFDESDIVTDQELGVLLGEVSFDYSYKMGSELLGTVNPSVKGSYVNGNYLGGFSIQVITSGGVAITDGDDTDSDADTCVLELTPSKTEAHRISVNTQSLTLKPGTYTYTWDVFVPTQSAAYTTHRLDIAGMGDSMTSSITSGRWVTLERSFTVTQAADGKIVVNDGKQSKTVGANDWKSVNLWLVKDSQSEYEPYYFDNFRLYYREITG